MPVYTDQPLDDLDGVIQRAANAFMSELTLRLTPEEYIATFIDPSHIPVLKQAEALVGMVGERNHYTTFTLNDRHEARLGVSFDGYNPPIILPEYVKNGPLINSAPIAVLERMSAYAEERVRLGRLFGDAIDALHYLNKNCSNGAAMAVVFPVLPSLFSAASDFAKKHYSTKHADAHQKKAEKIVSTKSFGFIPKLPPEVRDRAMDCSTFLSNVLMTGAQADPMKSGKDGTAKFNVDGMLSHYPDFIDGAAGAATFI